MVRRVAPAEMGAGTNARNAHRAHVPLHGFAIDHQLVITRKDDRDPPRPIGRLLRIDGVNRVRNRHLLGWRRCRLVLQAPAAQCQQIRLLAQG